MILYQTKTGRLRECSVTVHATAQGTIRVELRPIQPDRLPHVDIILTENDALELFKGLGRACSVTRFEP